MRARFVFTVLMMTPEPIRTAPRLFVMTPGARCASPPAGAFEGTLAAPATAPEIAFVTSETGEEQGRDRRRLPGFSARVASIVGFNRSVRALARPARSRRSPFWRSSRLGRDAAGGAAAFVQGAIRDDRRCS